MNTSISPARPSVEERAQLYNLIVTYSQLPEVEQRIVEILSVNYDSLPRTQICSCLTALKIRHQGRRQYQTSTLGPLLKNLTKRGLIEVDERVRLTPQLLEPITRHLLRSGALAPIAKAVVECATVPYRYNNEVLFRSLEQALRGLRIAIYLNRSVKEVFEAVYNCWEGFGEQLSQEGPLSRIFNHPFDPALMDSLNADVASQTVIEIVDHAIQHTVAVDAVVQWLEHRLSRVQEDSNLAVPLLKVYLASGRLEEAAALLGRLSQPILNAQRGCLALARGEAGAAFSFFNKGLKALGTKGRRGPRRFEGDTGVWCTLALIAAGTPQALKIAARHLKATQRWQTFIYTPAYSGLSEILDLKNDLLTDEQIEIARFPPPPILLNALFDALTHLWCGIKPPATLSADLLVLGNKATEAGQHHLAAQTQEVRARLCGDSAAINAATEALSAMGALPYSSLIAIESPWERKLNALAAVVQPDQGAATHTHASRLAWFIEHHPGHSRLRLEPREQKRRKGGGWTKGRVIALSRLFEDSDQRPYLTAQDLKVLAHLHREGHSSGWSRYVEYSYEFAMPDALIALVGHPNLVRANDPSQHVELQVNQPKVIIKESKGHLQLSMEPKRPAAGYALAEKGAGRIALTVWNASQDRMEEILHGGLTVPIDAQKQVLSIVEGLAREVTIESAIGLGGAQAHQVEADGRPHLRLTPRGEGLNARIAVCPIPGGPALPPGQGAKSLLAEVAGVTTATQRDLKLERRAVQDLMADCPSLAGIDAAGMDLPTPEDALQLLLELDEIDKEAVVVEWPKGQPFSLRGRLNSDALSLRLSSGKGWFDASGEAKVDDDLVLSLSRLLALLDSSEGPFVSLGDGAFLALTEELRRRLSALRGLGKAQGDGLRFHPLAAPAVDPLLNEVGNIDAGRAWKKHIKAIETAGAVKVEVPSTFQAQLRPYQEEGFGWLMRLGAWGAGACLADDMGLGKTLQALAAMVSRAPDGPSLVVAPTSVCLNWLEEAARFAPTLNVTRFGPGDRQAQLDAAGPFDVLVTSYGLMQLEIDRLAAKGWQMVVLDEAQAIKNPVTKRAKAARRLEATHRLALTGTPIENHLSDLWSLFAFINPGLLGSFDQFRRRFAVPIERDQDARARDALRALIRPFVLRRTKSEVLSELPAKTETLIHVELSEAEAALYETLRRQAVAELEGAGEEEGPGHLQVFAHLTRLRRACCNPSLVLGDKAPPSTKLAVFSKLLENIRENRHKALVFSQFVDHLSIIRQHLDAKNIPYQYLDGSTPPKKRGAAVKAFQRGEGDVFLISLKAGGLGLNLTAADYVLHLDPWWNPAVEDQATDRAHRIGQRRPVTVYRLVTQGTIEEKIVALHHQKRGLADRLLAGTNTSARLSAKELVALLKEAAEL